MTIGNVVVVWMLCAGLAYFIARDRVPSRAPLATLLGFLFGPLGVAATFFLKDENEACSEEFSSQCDRVSDSSLENVTAPSRSIAEITADIERMKKRLDE